MKRICGLFMAVVMFISIACGVVPAQAAATLAVAVNQSQVITLDGVERVAVANPDIADVVVVSSSEVLLVGKAPGDTTLFIWSATGRASYLVQVAGDDAPIANEIKTILGYPAIRVSKVGKTIILEGTVNDQYQKERAEKLAEAYGEKVVNLLELTKPVQVKIEAVVLEIDRQKEKDLGIIWGNSTTSPGIFAFGQSSTNGITGQSLGGLGKYSEINAQLSALIHNGYAKVLSQPSMITLSGAKASMLVGGQIPIPVSLQNGSITIEWKDYGIKLDIEPEVNGEGLINSKVKAEVSSLDWNATHKITLGPNLDIPPINMRRAETAIAMSSGQTMAIGGLISSDATKDVYKVPLLANIPVLGKLFTSSSFNRSETELLILITPTIVNPADYVPGSSNEMKAFAKENPWGGTADGGEDQSVNR